jgi:acetylornithine deacetylase/succinyl-diaminopimelate desuccinylase-like protein
MAHVPYRLVLLVVLLFPTKIYSQAPSAVDDVRSYYEANGADIIREFSQFLTIPNEATDRGNIRTNAEQLRTLMEKRGIRTRLIEVGDAPPAVYGELETSGAEHTILLYSHYDGTPVEHDKWESDPFRPVLRDGLLEEGARVVSLADLEGEVPGEYRLYARSASDEKLAIMGMLVGLDALQSSQRPLSVNLKFLFEGEEEIGSPHMPMLLAEHRELLRADTVLLCGGPVHSSRRLVIYFGARGNIVLDLTVYGATRHLHSGHYGNWAPNPIALLSSLISSMRDSRGNVLIEGYDDDVLPLTATEKQSLSEIPEVFDRELRAELGLAWNDADNDPLAERIMLPGINLGSIHAGPPRGTVSIPSEARASIGFRMVPDQTPATIRPLVESHIRKQGFHIVFETPDMDTRLAHPRIVKLEWAEPGSRPVRTSMDLPVSQALIQAMEEVVGDELIKLPTIGSGAPMELFQAKLEVPVIILPTANHDNNQHGPNENARLQNLWDGIEIFGNVFTRLGRLWH